MRNENTVIDILEEKMSHLPVDGGEIVLWELESENENIDSLNLIKAYLYENGYKSQFSNSDVYRLLLVRPRKA